MPYKFIEVGMRSVARTTIFTMQVCALAILGATAQLISFPLSHDSHDESHDKTVN